MWQYVKKKSYFPTFSTMSKTWGRIRIRIGLKNGKSDPELERHQHDTDCAAKAIFYCPSMNSHRPRSQNISKESTLNPEKDSTIKRPRSHVSLEKSSQNYKPLENWAKPNLLPDITPQRANSFGKCTWRVCHVVRPEPREFLAILISQINWPRTGERAGWIAVWSSSLIGW